MRRFIVAGLVVVMMVLVVIASVFAGGQDKVTLCHKGKNTLTVAAPAAAAHYAHGDTPGACPASPYK
jgi:hypothetical protein